MRQCVFEVLYKLADKLTQVQLTKTELKTFTPDLDSATAIRYIFLLWTLKEAYTKALGLGLGFDFKRIEYDILQGRVSVDGRPATGWEFLLFVVHTQGGTDVYQGAIARCVGGEETHFESISNVEGDSRFRLKVLADLL
jgi:4'-phosphopantetheinyl transferase